MSKIYKKSETLFRAFTAFVYERKYAALILMLLCTAGLASQLGKLTIDTRDESLFHATDPALIAYNDFKERFGQDEIFIVALQPAQGLDKDFFATLRRLHQELENTVPYIDEITSLANARVVRGDADTLSIEELFEHPPQTDEEAARIRKLIDHYPLYENFLVSRDRSTVSVIIRPLALKAEPEDVLAGFEQEEVEEEDAADRYLSNAESMEITEAIQKVIGKYQDPDLKIFFSGSPAVIVTLNDSIRRDLTLMLPLSLLVIIFFLTLLYRRLSGVVYPVLIVVLSLLSTLGFMALFNIPITSASQILPGFLVVVGIADGVHILTIFYRNFNRCGDKKQAVVDAVGFAGLPVLMTSVTTACGLLSFVWADIATLAQFGWIAPMGVLMAFVYTVILLPALIAIFPVRQGRGGIVAIDSQTDTLFSRIAAITTGRPIAVIAVFGLIAIISLYGVLTLRFSHDGISWFPEDAPIRIATERLDAVNGGTTILEILIDSGRENGLHDPDFLHRLDLAVARIGKLEAAGIRAGKVMALPDVLKETNRALHADQDEAYIVPETRELIAQELLLFEASGSDDLEGFTDSTFQTARISILVPLGDAVLYAKYMEKTEEYLKELFSDASVTMTGKMPLLVQIIKNSITTMTKSYTISLVIITLLMIVLVGQIRIGLMSMAANVVPILCVMGMMGIVNIPLDLGTMIIGSLVLGIVVDDTIHFLHHFRRAFEETGNVETAVRETLLSTGRALFITSMVLSGGFFIFTVGYMVSNVRFGVICGFAVLFALVADFFLVPALLTLVYRKAA
ncbi:MAG: MMPL family transporter [Candidatus Electrothrix communis]|nr:MAG: MMPL family transporter [Candidatus Electrothrix communis]